VERQVVAEETSLEFADVFSIFEKFQQILESINNSLNPEEIERKAVNVIHEHLKFSSFTFLVYDFNNKKFIFSCTKGTERNLAEHLIQEVVNWKEKLFSRSETLIPILTDEGNLKALPLWHKKKQLAVFIASPPILESLTPADKEFLRIIALSVLYAITNAKLYTMTKKLAVWDNKTNLYNYRYFLSRLSNEIARARRYGRKLSLVAMDIDDFKKINEEVGHLTADRILRDMAMIIKDSIRAVDIPSRFGGDEFFILLPETDIKGAKVVAERISGIIETKLFPLNSSKNRVRIKVTCGIAEYREEMTARELMEAADKNLLKIKKAKKEVNL